MKRKTIAPFALAAALVLSVSIQPASAYFTDNAQAKGGYVVTLGGTDIEEEFYNWTKHVTIVSEPGSQANYIRAKAFSGTAYELVYSGEGWTPGGDGWYYCDEILYGGQTTAELRVQIQNVPEEVAAGDSFNVVILYESTPVLYDANGSPYADWYTEGGGEG